MAWLGEHFTVGDVSSEVAIPLIVECVITHPASDLQESCIYTAVFPSDSRFLQREPSPYSIQQQEADRNAFAGPHPTDSVRIVLWPTSSKSLIHQWTFWSNYLVTPLSFHPDIYWG